MSFSLKSASGEKRSDRELFCALVNTIDELYNLIDARFPVADYYGFSLWLSRPSFMEFFHSGKYIYRSEFILTEPYCTSSVHDRDFWLCFRIEITDQVVTITHIV